MLSLSPRYDLFRFVLPKDFLPKEIEEKYHKVLNKNAGVIVKPIDYLNESIKGITIPGINDLLMTQDQHEHNPIIRSDTAPAGLGRINIEPNHTVNYKTSLNPLEKIDKELKVTFRMNQGLYNYYMLYETIFHRVCKHIDAPIDDILYVEILNDQGEICGRIVFENCDINGIDGLDFSYDKTTRDSGDFSLSIKFNNINFEFLP